MSKTKTDGMQEKEIKKLKEKNSIRSLFSRLFFYHPHIEYDFTLPQNDEERITINLQNAKKEESSKEASKETPKIYTSLDVNLEYMKVQYNSMINSDIIIRPFTLIARNKQYHAFIMYIDGMVDSKTINDFLLEPLMLRNRANIYDTNSDNVVSSAVSNNITVRKVKRFNLVDYVFTSLMPQNSVKMSSDFDEIISGINSGNCALFIDTIDTAFDIEVKGFKQRSVDTPNNEIVIRGSQEAFNEIIRTNTSMLRRLINNENLIIENIEVGALSKTKCAICYMKNIANDDLVAEVKYRLNNVDVDYLISSGQLEQLIEDKSSSSLPQVLATERPDKASNYLLEGRVVVIVNGSPYVLIMPGTFLDFIASPEDINLKYQFANLLKLIRLFAIVITLLLPGIYVAITTFHQELIPTELLFAIVASRESVPFPVISEIIVMELSFELIREAGIRVPSPIGPTIGIVGALVLRTSCCGCQYCKSYFDYFSCYYCHFFFCYTRFFSQLSLSNCPFCLYPISIFLWLSRYSIRSVCSSSTSCQYEIFWSTLFSTLCTYYQCNHKRFLPKTYLET